jgi:DNA-binding GntR family transcriptional regulator
MFPSRKRHSPESNADRAYDLIRRHIIFGQFEPGEVLSEEVLMTRFQLGRTPIREAMVRLGHEGLVTAFPRRGTQVRGIDFTDLMAIYEVRAPLESQAGRLAAVRVDDTTRAASRKLGGAIEKLKRPTKDEGRALLKLDEDVHRFVYAASRSPLLHEALDHYLDLSLRIIYVLLPTRPRLNDALSESLTRHGVLLAAIEDGDADRAADAMSAGLRDFQQALSGAANSLA